MRQQQESRKSKGGPLDLKDYLWIWRRPQTWLLLLKLPVTIIHRSMFEYIQDSK